MQTEQTIYVEENDTGMRLDKFVAEHVEAFSRTYVQKLIANGLVTVNGSSVTPKYLLQKNDQINILTVEAVEADIAAEQIDLDIVYQDTDVIVVNKPRGMVVHPAAGHSSGTLVNALMGYSPKLSTISGVLRPGIVHRIDKDTSGLLMIARNDAAHQSLAAQLKAKTTKRIYIALVDGNVVHDKGMIDAPIGRDPRDRKKMVVVDTNGKDAVTHFRVLQRFGKYTLIECQLETGRTHQIRVHLKYIGHPLVGDYVYGKSKNEFGLEGQFLHAAVIGFVHPVTDEYMEFSSPLPEALQIILDKLEFSLGNSIK